MSDELKPEMKPEPTVSELQAEIARLQGHANDLLVERRAEKARREEADAARLALLAEHEAAIKTLQDVALWQPVERVIGEACRGPTASARLLLEHNGFAFRLGEHGAPVFEHAGATVPLADLHAHLTRLCDTPEGKKQFAWFTAGSKATGGGATGGFNGPGHLPVRQGKQEPAPKFGLR